ncbi:MAG: prepilin-type N-terminal cleavage/methylation domain-containing protein [Candidatus Falkowbacteria bacterium]|nr:prepilin-type N-terminal cleavage/methylation domain-containing protein [Candidatus Falkowbacteria bacterium]
MMPLSRKKFKFGFTLIELLVVIAIIGVLSTMAIIALGNARTKARDTKRVADIKQISTALELYYADNNSYPTIITPGNSLVSPDGTKTYMGKIPSNPTPRNEGNCGTNDYAYSINSNNSFFSVSACLGSANSNINAGLASYSPNGLFSCGQSITDLDGYSYTTVQIGGQCWMGSNLRTKKYPNGNCINSNCPDASIADNTLGRSCYSNVEANCTSDGALYTWPVAMNNSTVAGAQGICPIGWHLPSDADYKILEMSLGMSQAEADATLARGTHSEGDKLKKLADCSGGTSCASSGYNGPLSGIRAYWDGATFYYRLGTAFIWTSTMVGGSAWYRSLDLGLNTVGRSYEPQGWSFAVRCLKD